MPLLQIPFDFLILATISTLLSPSLLHKISAVVHRLQGPFIRRYVDNNRVCADISFYMFMGLGVIVC